MADYRELIEAVRRRWREIDPLLPAPLLGGGEMLTAGPKDRPVAAGQTDYTVPRAGTLEETWFPPAGHRLVPLAPGIEELDRLLTRWREHLDEWEPVDGAEATLSWPSRDVDAVPVLSQHGLQPRTVLAVRASGRATPPAPGPSDLRVRAARPYDLEAVVALRLAEIRFDQRFGTIHERPNTASLLREQTAALLGAPRPWIWLAERGTRPVGVVVATPPEATSWIASSVAAISAAYIDCMSVAEGDRGGGAGAALAAAAHAAADGSGAAMTVLHYAQLNPLSVPFWSRMGYRPLWTQWVATPISSLR